MSSIVQNNKKILTDDWKTLKFSDCILQLNTGLNPRNHFSLGSGEIKYITAKNLTKTGIIDFSKCDFINETAKKIINKRSEIQVGDILFSSRAPIGHCHLIKEEPDFYDIGESIFSIRANQDIIIPEYLCLYLSSDYFIKMASKQTTGSIISEIRISDLMNIEIIVPPKNIQMNIAKCIGEIDKKLQINNRINAELESMAKTIYDYWFTQFDFPDENGKPYKSSGGKMVWNEELKREIPEGWGIKKLDEFSKVITKGTTPSTLGGEFVDKSNISFIKVESIENGFINGDISYISEKTQELMQRSKLEENDILITIAGRLGSVCVVPDFVLPANTNQAVAIVRLLDKDLVWFLRASMMSDENKYYYANVNAQSIQKNLNLPNVGNTKIMCDNELKYADLYNKKVNSIYKKINSNIQQNRELASLRDWLLPMLMNGQVGFEGVE